MNVFFRLTSSSFATRVVEIEYDEDVISIFMLKDSWKGDETKILKWQNSANISDYVFHSNINELHNFVTQTQERCLHCSSNFTRFNANFELSRINPPNKQNVTVSNDCTIVVVKRASRITYEKTRRS